MPANLLVFDDRVARRWRPFTLTRPAGELRFGTLTLRERHERVFGARCVGHIAADHLEMFDEPSAPPVVPAPVGPVEEDTLLVSSRAVLEWPVERPGLGSQRTMLFAGDRPCGWFVPRGAEPPSAEALLDPDSATYAVDAELRMEGSLLEHVWDLVSGNSERTARDIHHLCRDASPAKPPEGVWALGSEPLVIGRGVVIEPGVVLDLRQGPIWFQDGIVVGAFSRIAGPTHIAPDTVLFGGAFDSVSAGPACKLRGEMQECVILGYSNKAHDGYIGHAYIGAWVNLGAFTTNSDLKNNYGNVSVWTLDGAADTGILKLGCLIGDHVKTAIGTLLNTGTVIGAGANVVGTGFPPKYVPPFQWGTGETGQEYDLEKFLETAALVMARRGVPLSAKQRQLLAAAWRTGRSEL